jgi:hypothetical protein
VTAALVENAALRVRQSPLVPALGRPERPLDRVLSGVGLTTATWFFAAVFSVRVLVQVPLYLADAPDALAATKLLMGVPLYLGLLWVTWMLVRTAWKSADDPEE